MPLTKTTASYDATTSVMIRTEQQVLDLVMELEDPESWLYRQFYSEVGVRPTLLESAPQPSHEGRILLKNETAHMLRLGDRTYHAASFKRRGALLAGLLCKRANPGATHFVTASHGNHGIGVAMAAKTLGMKAEIYCPESVNDAKLRKLRTLGAAVHAKGLRTFEEAMSAAELASGRKTAALIHPFNQAEVIAGQATIGLEIVRDLLGMATRREISLHKTLIEIDVAVAGGGLLTGVAIVLKRYKDLGILGRDNVRLVGAQMAGCDAARRCVANVQNGGAGVVAAFQDGEFNDACDSTAVREVGTLTLPFLADRDYVQEFRLVSESEVGRSMYLLTNLYGKLVEPAGALAYAAVRQRMSPAPSGETSKTPTVYIAPVCGANVTRETYRYFQKRAAETSAAPAKK